MRVWQAANVALSGCLYGRRDARYHGVLSTRPFASAKLRICVARPAHAWFFQPIRVLHDGKWRRV
jgi:hypothetical protein